MPQRERSRTEKRIDRIMRRGIRGKTKKQELEKILGIVWDEGPDWWWSLPRVMDNLAKSKRYSQKLVLRTLRGGVAKDKDAFVARMEALAKKTPNKYHKRWLDYAAKQAAVFHKNVEGHLEICLKKRGVMNSLRLNESLSALENFMGQIHTTNTAYLKQLAEKSPDWKDELEKEDDWYPHVDMLSHYQNKFRSKKFDKYEKNKAKWWQKQRFFKERDKIYSLNSKLKWIVKSGLRAKGLESFEVLNRIMDGDEELVKKRGDAVEELQKTLEYKKIKKQKLAVEKKRQKICIDSKTANWLSKLALGDEAMLHGLEYAGGAKARLGKDGNLWLEPVYSTLTQLPFVSIPQHSTLLETKSDAKFHVHPYELARTLRFPKMLEKIKKNTPEALEAKRTKYGVVEVIKPKYKYLIGGKQMFRPSKMDGWFSQMPLITVVLEPEKNKLVPKLFLTMNIGGMIRHFDVEVVKKAKK
ncbi:MAG: hypothetical protein KAW41_02125 [Candidatus Diapherotrites archaeon]|nr:hypothetical protein [Candidatus Diapherotrites archaeon]